MKIRLCHICAILAPLIILLFPERLYCIKIEKMISANDSLREHTSSEAFYKYNFGLVITSGTKSMADTFGVYWFLDIIASYQGQLRNEEFQVWTLTRKGSSAIITASDGNDRLLISQPIPFTDFEPDVAVLWLEGNVILLPGEH